MNTVRRGVKLSWNRLFPGAFERSSHAHEEDRLKSSRVYGGVLNAPAKLRFLDS